jgi:hypothetical protein
LCEGWTQNGPTWKGWNERWFSATQSLSGSVSQVHPAPSAGLRPSPKISIRHGPSRDSSRLVTTNPSSAKCSSEVSLAARSFAGTSSQAVQPPLTPPR